MLLEDCHAPAPCGSVPEGHHLCLNGVCVPPEALCDFTDDCGDYSDEEPCGETRDVD